MKKKLLLTICLMLISSTAFAWDGYDEYSYDDVTIERGNTVRKGKNIEVYNWSTGETSDVTVESVRERFGSVEVKVYDYDTGETRYLKMKK